MPGHPDLQGAFAAGLISGHLPPGVTARDPAEAPRRYDVYRNNISHSLTQALGTKFPVIERLVGEAFFAAMARMFADNHRPKTPVLMFWGDAFPDFLAGFPPLAAYPYMADVARIELARGLAYHAADHAPLAPEALQALAASGGDGPLLLHPSVQLVRSPHPAVTIWQGNQPGHVPGDLAGKGPEIALVLRDRALDVAVERVTAGDAALIAALQAGATLMAAATAAATEDPGHDPSSLLARLFQAGALIPGTIV
jgi:hypothetical protein